MKTVVVIPERCVGCRQCEFACAVEHSASKDPYRAVFETPRPKPRLHVEMGPRVGTSFPVTCRHCDPAPCEAVCPTGALQREPDHGRVLVRVSRCIDCATCALVCPFDAVTFHPQADGGPARVVATKCDGCVDRLARGDDPACVEACKSGALVFAEANEVAALGRRRQSAQVLTARAAEGAAPVPPAVAGWRAWGERLEALSQGSVR